MTLEDDIFEQPPGSTLISEDDRVGLIPSWVATRADLNIAERANIGRALIWAGTKSGPHSISELLTDSMLKELHQQMFADVWKWAGSYRHHDTNIGIHWPLITTQLHNLLGDVRVQAADSRRLPWPADELAVRFHHRLTVIHPFPNGNGRHARLAADILVSLLGRPAFSWGADALAEPTETRAQYIAALVHADRMQDFEPLATFARS